MGDYENGGGITKFHHLFFGVGGGGITKSDFRISQILTFSNYYLPNFRGYAAYHTIFQYYVTYMYMGEAGKSSSTMICSMCSLIIDLIF